MPIDSKTPIKTALASNSLSPGLSFQFRKYWKESGMTSDLIDVKPLDFWYGKLFHGRVNQKGEVVYPSETNLKQVPTTSDTTYWALDFVVDAFADLQLHMKRAVGRGAIIPDSAMSSLEPSRGWVSANLDYNSHIESVYDYMVTSWLQRGYRNSKVKNFTDFLREFLEMVDDSAETFHFTKSGHILSRYFSPLSSGLIIETALGDHSEDALKAQGWTNDPNFPFYRNAAKNHGFLVDKNAPWRLIADINSAPMQKYMSQYGISGKNLFDTYYYKSHRLDIEALKIYLVEMYNAYAIAYPEVKELRTKMKGSGDVRTVSRLVARNLTDLNEVNKLFPPEYWLKTYYYIRLREMQAPVDNVSFNNEVEKIYRTYKFLDFDKALDYINDKIRKLKVP